MKKDKNEDQDKKLEELEKTVSESNEKYLRALADYQNLQKQTDSWKEEFVQFANSSLVRKLLEVLDDLEKAQEHLRDEGLKLIVEKLQNVLREEGLEEIEVLGKEFDPATAEVVSTQPGEKNNIIVKVLQKGNKIKDKIIRVARVIASTKDGAEHLKMEDGVS